MDHVQRILVEDQGRLFNGSFYPDENYDVMAPPLPDDGPQLA